MRSKRDIKKGRLCTRRGEGGGGGLVLGIVDGGCNVRLLNRDTISDQNMPFFIRLHARGCLENHTRFQTIMDKIISVF